MRKVCRNRKDSKARHLKLAWSAPQHRRCLESHRTRIQSSAPKDDRSDDELLLDMDSSFLAEVLAIRARMTAVLVAERRGLHELDGFEAVEPWFANRFGMGLMKASEFVRVAEALEDLPELDRAFKAGRVSYDHLRWLTRVATTENELDLLRQVEGTSLSDTARLVKKIEGVTAEESRHCRTDRYVEMRWDMEGRFLLLNGLLPEEQGSVVERAINSLAKQIPDDPEEVGSMPNKRADALAELASSALGISAPNVKVLVHIEAESLLSGVGSAEIESGPSVSPETVRRLSCDSLIQEVVNRSDGKPIALGRSRRTVTPRMLQQLRLRDAHCRWPGCRRKNLLDAHHITHWTDGGPTDYDNLLLLCRTHHYMVHEGGYSLRGDPPHVWVEKPSGEPLKCGPPGSRLLR